MVEDGLKEEQEIQDFNYLRSGLDAMFDNENCGFLPAFLSQSINDYGFSFTLESFIEFLADYEVDVAHLKLPEEFVLRIRFSPIALFKFWIFNISNVDKLKISERSKGYDRDFYFLMLDDIPHMVPITTNIAHERYLVLLYTRSFESVQTMRFATTLMGGKKLILYKDYKRKKVSSVDFSGDFTATRKYNFRVSYMKSETRIRFSVVMENKHKVTHAIRIADGADPVKTKAKESKPVKEIIEECKSQVVEILEGCKKSEFKTNKHANVSLGRVNKIPILLNLSKKFSDYDVLANYNNKEEVLIITDVSNKKELKRFKISNSPKSNWLESC